MRKVKSIKYVLRRFYKTFKNDYNPLTAAGITKTIYDIRRGRVSGEYVKVTLPHNIKMLLPNKKPILNGFTCTYDEIYMHDMYEKFKEFKPREDDVILDLGAFIGLYTFKHCRKVREVHTFEPIKESYNIIEDTVMRNNLRNISLYNFALGSFNERRKIYLNDVMLSSSSLDRGWCESNNYEVVEVRTLDSLANILPKTINIMKVDIEGSEYELLEGGENVIKGRVEKMVFEVHKNKTYDLFYRKLRDFNFSAYGLKRYANTEILYLINKK